MRKMLHDELIKLGIKQAEKCTLCPFESKAFRGIKHHMKYIHKGEN